jgi:hypothetical protein
MSRCSSFWVELGFRVGGEEDVADLPLHCTVSLEPSELATLRDTVVDTKEVDMAAVLVAEANDETSCPGRQAPQLFPVSQILTSGVRDAVL